MFRPITREKTNDFSTLDIETDTKTGDLLAGAVYDGEAVTFFESWSEFFKLVESQHRVNKKWQKFVAHGGGIFDYVSMIEYLFDTGYDYKIIMSGSRIVFVSLTIKKTKIVFYDSLQVLLKGLDSLCETFKPEHRKLKIEIEKIQEIYKKDRKQFNAYLANDVKSLYDICHKFMDLLDIKFFPCTISSLSLYLFRRDFLKKSLKLITDKKVDAFISESYAGGRVECFKYGKHKKVFVYDINSLYPYVMQKSDIPVNLPVRVNSYKQGQKGFYRVSFYQANQTLPPVLWVKSKNGLEFCYEGEGVFYSAEIELALKYGVDIKFKDGYVFPETQPMFREFVDHFYALRKNNKGTALDYIAKIAMNSQYGKYGQKTESTELEKITDNKKVLALMKNPKIKITLYNEEKQIYALTGEKKITHRMIQVASCVTSEARCILYEYLVKYRHDIIYCDTDSVHLTKKISENIGVELGQLKIEAEGSGIYLGRKQYQIADKLRFKGIKANDKLTGNALNKKHFEKILKTGKADFKYGIFPKIKSVIKGDKACKMKIIKKKMRPSEYKTNYK